MEERKEGKNECRKFNFFGDGGRTRREPFGLCAGGFLGFLFSLFNTLF
jgi:hypothetical protein